MRKLTMVSVISILCMIAMPVMAQEQTLISGNVEHGGFGGPVLKITQFRDEVGLMVGGRGGWVINHVLVIGGAGYGLTTNIDAPVYDRYLNVDYGGGVIEFIMLSDRLIHLAVNALIGGGEVYYRERDRDYWDEDWRNDGDRFFVAEPGVDLVVNVTRNIRLGAGVTYRYVDGIDLRGLSDSDISGLSATFTLKFGKF